MAASSEGNLGLVNTLLQAGAQVHSSDSDGKTALYYAVYFDHVDCLRTLLTSGAVITARDGRWCAIKTAVLRGRVDCLRAVLEHPYAEGVIETRDPRGCTAVFYAVKDNGIQCAQLLLNKGALTDVVNSAGQTALMYAASFGKPDYLQFLLEQPSLGDLINTQDDRGWTVLHHAAWNGFPECIKVALSNNADLTVANTLCETPLMLAALRNHIDCVCALLNSDRSEETLDMCNMDGETALHYAVDKDYAPTINLLLDAGADQTAAAAKLGVTPLMLSCSKTNLDALRTLLSHPTYNDALEMKGIGGFTALHLAARKGSSESVKRLLEAGANVKEISNDGRTPLLIAEQRGHREVVRLLAEAAESKRPVFRDETAQDEPLHTHRWRFLRSPKS